jgi:hypothetical protein
MDVTMKHILRFEFFQEPAITGKALVTGVFSILQITGRGVGQKNI